MAFYTLFSWGLVIALGVFTTYYYNPDAFNKFMPKTPAVAQSELMEEKKVRKSKSKTSGSSAPTLNGQNLTNRKPKATSSLGNGVVSSSMGSNGTMAMPKDDDQRARDRADALQMAKARAGTTLVSASKPAGASGKKKGGRGKDETFAVTDKSFDSPAISTSTSSTTGADGDDDLSLGSPQSGPLSSAPTSRAGDISDMLEPETPRPMTLNITRVSEPKARPAAKKEFEPVLNKKQRQRQKENADRARLVKESNAEHAARGAQQMRTARIAEGSAKQLRTDNWNKPQGPNVWAAGTGKTMENVTGSVLADGTLQMLDTIELNKPAQTSPSKETVSVRPLGEVANTAFSANNNTTAKAHSEHNKSSALAVSDRKRLDQNKLASRQWSDEMDEEEQLRHLREQEQEEAWQTAPGKKSKKKNAKNDADASSDASSGALPSNSATTKAPVNGTKQTPEVSMNRFQSFAGHED